ncbi:menin-like [Varroa jacobsoni]|uniref:Menin n=1 Tax=Varroa destructor TaxID=109461 RepID=A0A7M7JYC7_VARDE|nr:menin-like [Varroa destructor]XP_022652875.1 menin-like [Varroa destructor]XP_022652876.1 menin-like [Varroa destructor]XP_022652877.1 menin-like [Varroa destructor]XP_022652878.1 menin-like [Varroa destructor]XP_022652879.1 menin-like [Varroa destructor]XP_022652880.1 menin-like [Varroa destructor]XP_022652881.1 menin-like [Varroa destructor]XP_022652882.1 menin-like [Varroa destructor]XP_022652883.1 menin-like [Varroa destructor]XP_022652885.1 menin-like [Varroa destructor]XP_022652
MAIPAKLKKLFPLRSVDDLVNIFRCMLDGPSAPDLTLTSIILGYLENVLCAKPPSENAVSDSESQSSAQEDFPIVNLEEVSALYSQFSTMIRGSVDLSVQETGPQRRLTRPLVKKISDVIWDTLHRSYGQDRPHLQSIFSYLTANKLDCFGLAYTTVAACQVLNVSDVRLCLSEDHAWIMYVDAVTGREETAEVTWHGKVEDRRGLPISLGERSWLYLNGHAIECTRYTEVAAAILAMNPYASSTADSELLIQMQKKLLWLMYDGSHLRGYPMALGILGELESMQDSPEAEHTALELFQEAVEIGRTVYANHHVYPYTYLGSFMFRCQRFADALHCYASAAQVIRNFNYGREDEEIYKEFMEVNNEIVPQLIKYDGIVEDATCFAQLLRLWDGLCGWEEGSSTPVLHIGWAKPFVSVLNKFPASTRKAVHIVSLGDPADSSRNNNNEIKSENDLQPSPSSGGEDRSETPTRRGSQSRKSRNQAQHLHDRNAEESTSGQPVPGPADRDAKEGEASQDMNDNDIKKEFRREESPGLSKVSDEERAFREEHEKKQDTVVFSSQKMIGLRHLLLADKLNISAIQLQLTAQSHLAGKHKLDDDSRRKRVRRE